MADSARYLIVGDGQVARHFRHYFSMLGLSTFTWSRRARLPLADVVPDATHVLLLISDRAIASFYQSHAGILQNKICLHFSGSLRLDSIVSAHPLMTFAGDFFPEATYRSVPFILNQNEVVFQELLPGLPNPHFYIPSAAASYYHALCVMANNFTTLLWSKAMKEFQRRWGLPQEVLFPILRQTCAAIESSRGEALSGPIARQDWATIEANMAALSEDPYLSIYDAFVNSIDHNKEKSS